MAIKKEIVEVKAKTSNSIEVSIGETLEELQKAPKEKIKLWKPADPELAKQMADEVVVINGVFYQIKRGVEVEVPAPVVEVLRNAGRL